MALKMFVNIKNIKTEKIILTENFKEYNYNKDLLQYK